MATIKSFTSLEQSRKLAEILPLESADMAYIKHSTSSSLDWRFDDDMPRMILGNVPVDEITAETLPCWSLTALLGVLPKKYYPIKDHETDLILGKPKDKWCALYWDASGIQDGEQTLADNPVDACVEMILKLHEEGLL